jgi:hypothetical protein
MCYSLRQGRHVLKSTTHGLLLDFSDMVTFPLQTKPREILLCYGAANSTNCKSKIEDQHS